MLSNRPGGESDHISRYFSASSAYTPKFSPDGQRVVFLSDITGVPQVWQVLLCRGVEEPLWPDPALRGREAVEDLTQRFTLVLEKYVREYPGHYFWMHRRWKTAPPVRTNS